MDDDRFEELCLDLNYDSSLREVFEGIYSLKELNFYENLLNKLGINKTGFRRMINVGPALKLEEMREVPLIDRAYKNLSNPLFYFPDLQIVFNSDLITFHELYFLYKFLEVIYFRDVGRKLDLDDLNKLYFSSIAEKLIFSGDIFDKDFSIPKITSDYFKNLKKLKWEPDGKNVFENLSKIKSAVLYANRQSELYSNPTFPPVNKLRTILISFIFPRSSTHSVYWDFSLTEDSFLLFLSGCSAVNDKRDKINKSDVVKAYKTYFKLLSADISGLVDNLWEEQLE